MEFIETGKVKISLKPEQIKQISPIDKINRAIKNDNIFCYNILKDEVVVGFCLLRKYSDFGFFLWDFAIDEKYQNKGYGTQALLGLFKFLKKQFNATELTTTYNFGNNHAKHVYEKVGFAETGVVKEDDIHEVNMIKYL